MTKRWMTVLVLLLLRLPAVFTAIFLFWAPRVLYTLSPAHAGSSGHRLLRRGLQHHTLIGSVASPLSPAFLSVSAALSFPADLPRFPNFPHVCGRARKWHPWQMELSIRRDGWSKVVSGRQRSSSCAENLANGWSCRFLCSFHVFLLPFVTHMFSSCLFCIFFLTAPKDKVKRLDSVEPEAGEIRLQHQGRV